MGNNKKLAKLGIIVTAVVIVFGVALFVFKGQEKKVEPVENDFSITRIQEDTPNEVDLIENENKFKEVETETVEDIEEIVDKAIEEMDKEDTDHLEGITIHSNEDSVDSEETESVDSEKTDSEKSDSSKEDSDKADSDKADSSKDSSEKSDSNKGNNEKSDSEKSDGNVDNSTTNKVDTEQGNTETKTDNNGQANNGEQNSTVNTPSTQSTPVVVEQPTSQPELTDEYYANLCASWGVEFGGDVSGASGSSAGGPCE